MDNSAYMKTDVETLLDQFSPPSRDHAIKKLMKNRRRRKSLVIGQIGDTRKKKKKRRQEHKEM